MSHGWAWREAWRESWRWARVARRGALYRGEHRTPRGELDAAAQACLSERERPPLPIRLRAKLRQMRRQRAARIALAIALRLPGA